jgi:hypothetical protein
MLLCQAEAPQGPTASDFSPIHHTFSIFAHPSGGNRSSPQFTADLERVIYRFIYHLISLEETLPLQLWATLAIANNTLDLGPGQLESPGHICV